MNMASAENESQGTVRRWLEDAWRHGEIVVDGDGHLVFPAARLPLLARLQRRWRSRRWWSLFG
ncbi:MAG: hypothetical protein IT340_10900 [Chloroflexi bacterium]|nr:hypothetical protein [Chloroflexota bacterium]